MKSKAKIELLVHQEILDKPDTNETIYQALTWAFREHS